MSSSSSPNLVARNEELEISLAKKLRGFKTTEKSLPHSSHCSLKKAANDESGPAPEGDANENEEAPAQQLGVLVDNERQRRSTEEKSPHRKSPFLFHRVRNALHVHRPPIGNLTCDAEPQPKTEGLRIGRGNRRKREDRIDVLAAELNPSAHQAGVRRPKCQVLSTPRHVVKQADRCPFDLTREFERTELKTAHRPAMLMTEICPPSTSPQSSRRQPERRR